MLGIFKRKKEKETDIKNEGLPLEFEDIKKAIESKNESPFLEDNPTIPKTVELEGSLDFGSFEPQPKRNIEPPKETAIRKPLEKPEVYVKIDKYKEILETLDSIIIKIKEIEGIVQELKDIKEREGNRIADWERELEELKNKISFVLSSLEGE